MTILAGDTGRGETHDKDRIESDGVHSQMRCKKSGRPVSRPEWLKYWSFWRVGMSFPSRGKSMCRDPEVEGESAWLKEAREAGMMSTVSMRESNWRPEGLYRCAHRTWTWGQCQTLWAWLGGNGQRINYFSGTHVLPIIPPDPVTTSTARTSLKAQSTWHREFFL